ncbi:hypothetical protein [Maricaulis sp.]|uniref:hypothetical protein n=1 Tax=Maricaulis sp. TaxID=1486257 RepID=UPI00261F99E4|nr:hypothetical protein [Maricaulis sp.]
MSLALALTAGPALAQNDASGSDDPNLRNPEIFAFEVDGAEVQYVVGDDAWGNIFATLMSVQQVPEASDETIIQRLWDERNNNAPIFLMEVARRAADSNPERAIEAYLLGRARTIYDISRCLDSSSARILNVTTAQAGPEVDQLLNDRLDYVSTVLEEMLADGSAFEGTASPWWACSFGDTAQAAAVNGVPMSGPEWLKVEARWASERRSINDNLLYQINLVRTASAQREAE